MTIKVSQKRDRKWLFDHIDQLSVFQYYIPGIEYHKKMKSPIRYDKHEGNFGIFSRDNVVFFKDFAEDSHKGSCIDLVMKMFGLESYQAIEKIAIDIGIISSTGEVVGKVIYADRVEHVKQSSLIQVSESRWSKRHTDYWTQFGIGIKTLKQEQVYPVKEWYLNRLRQEVKDNELCFAYRYLEDKFKIYYPERKKGNKWVSNISTRVVEGLEQLNGHKQVVICKSKKDRLTLKSLLPEQIGLISVQNESISAYTDSLLEVLSGRDVYVSYDSDYPGKAASQRITDKFGYKHINTPDQYLPLKDWAEVYKLYGSEPIIEHFKNKKLI